MSSYNHFGCSWCKGLFNGGNCPGCSSVGSGNEFVYDPNPYSYNDTPNFFNQPPQHQYETYSCELSGDSPHYGFDCQTWTPLVYEQDPCPHYGSDCQMINVFYEHAPYDNHDSFGFDQPSQFTSPQPLPLSELTRQELIKYMIKSQEVFNINQEKFNIDVQNESNRPQEMLNLRNSNQDPLVDLYDLKGSDKGDNKIDSLTKELFDTLLMGDEVISTTPIRENDEFIKSSVNDFFLILRDLKVTLVCDDLECNMPITTHLFTTDVREEKLDIDLPLGEHLDTLSTGDREINFNPSRDIEELERLLADDLVPVPRVFDEPLGNYDLVPRYYDVTFSNPLFDFNDDYTLCYDNPLFDEEFEDIYSLDPLSRL
nr:NAC domain-containing protein [Tanacetum cinerariifolium]